MSKTMKVVVILVLIGAAGGLMIYKQHYKAYVLAAEGEGQTKSDSAPAAKSEKAAIPKLVDLGAGKCIPCKAMKPILEDLSANYSSTFETVFIDVWENPDAGKPYGINLIPTQIFFDADGKELFRHEGFYSKEAILNKWKEFGVEANAEQAESVL